MIPRYFPRCEVEGSITPAKPFVHLTLEGAVPAKCGSCKLLFEGECRRNPHRVHYMHLDYGYMHLDHGPCPIPGDTSPVTFTFQVEDRSYTVFIPRKCENCKYLGSDDILLAYCNQDSEIWGDFQRGLDWGSWEPEPGYIDALIEERVERTLEILKERFARGEITEKEYLRKKGNLLKRTGLRE